MNPLKSHFLLDPEVIFLNHGSFGATPKPVFEVYQNWQRQLERQPVKFLGRDLSGYLKEARAVVSSYLKVNQHDLVFVPNATFGVNIAARSLGLKEGDEVLTTNQEYGACNNVWNYLSERQGFSYKQQPITLPVKDNASIVEEFWQGVTPATRVIYLSHITSPTALIFPVEEICARARREGIITVIDGAHAPGQIPLDLSAIGADFYTGNCHKWLCSPKGAGFLHVRQEHQSRIEPVVIGWGLTREAQYSMGSKYLDYYEWLGTNDFSAYLSIPAAIKFQAEHNWPELRKSCHALLKDCLERIHRLTGLESIYGDDSFYAQLAIASIPQLENSDAFKNKLYDDYRIEIPLTQHKDRQFVRISVQAYVSEDDLRALETALAEMLKV